MQSLAAKLESSIQKRTDEVANSLVEVETKLLETIAIIHNALQSQSYTEQAQSRPVSLGKSKKETLQTIKPGLEALAKQIKKYDATASDAVEVLIGQIDNPDVISGLNELKHLLASYNFKAAATALNSLMGQSNEVIHEV